MNQTVFVRVYRRKTNKNKKMKKTVGDVTGTKKMLSRQEEVSCGNLSLTHLREESVKKVRRDARRWRKRREGSGGKGGKDVDECWR